MICLSVRQPWASSVFLLGKGVENRKWTTKYRGMLVIHSCGQQDPTFWESQEFQTLKKSESIKKNFQESKLECQVLIGIVDLVGIEENNDSDWARPDRFHWILKNPEIFQNPIPAKGQQGLWRPTESQSLAILNELKKNKKIAP